MVEWACVLQAGFDLSKSSHTLSLGLRDNVGEHVDMSYNGQRLGRKRCSLSSGLGAPGPEIRPRGKAALWVVSPAPHTRGTRGPKALHDLPKPPMQQRQSQPSNPALSGAWSPSSALLAPSGRTVRHSPLRQARLVREAVTCSLRVCF